MYIHVNVLKRLHLKLARITCTFISYGNTLIHQLYDADNHTFTIKNFFSLAYEIKIYTVEV